jgi:hypothetical protein
MCDHQIMVSWFLTLLSWWMTEFWRNILPPSSLVSTYKTTWCYNPKDHNMKTLITVKTLNLMSI